MRGSLKSSGRRPSTGWYWPLVLLALPNCFLDSFGEGPGTEFFPGAGATSAIMCDIPKVPGEGDSLCANEDQAASGISLTEAAIALAEGRKSDIGLDFSPDKLAECEGNPAKTVFYGDFPDGLAVCLNCGSQIPALYADATEVCVAKCKDLINFGGGLSPADGVDAFCTAHARPSTNFNKDLCFDHACSGGGTLLPEFVDPRRAQELVVWIDQFGTDNSQGSNYLTRTALTSGPNDVDFNAGGASAQLITAGDAWVEFGVPPGPTETTLSHVLGVRASCDDVAACPDNDPGLGDIGFAISLNSDGSVYVLESGTALQVFGPFGAPYTADERFRVKIKDNHDGTATITYSRLSGSCTPGTGCEFVFHESDGPAPQYPLRVNATLREQGATIANVTMVRIQ